MKRNNKLLSCVKISLLHFSLPNVISILFVTAVIVVNNVLLGLKFVLRRFMSDLAICEDMILVLT